MDQRYTDHVIDAMGPKTSPRLRKALGSLIQHIHDFTRENQITVEEWMAGMQLINSIGQISDEKRDEAILVSDVLGMES
jgi:catechol 1,2-dioxygenase